MKIPGDSEQAGGSKEPEHSNLPSPIDVRFLLLCLVSSDREEFLYPDALPFGHGL